MNCVRYCDCQGIYNAYKNHNQILYRCSDLYAEYECCRISRMGDIRTEIEQLHREFIGLYNTISNATSSFTDFCNGTAADYESFLQEFKGFFNDYLNYGNDSTSLRLCKPSSAFCIAVPEPESTDSLMKTD